VGEGKGKTKPGGLKCLDGSVSLRHLWWLGLLIGCSLCCAMPSSRSSSFSSSSSLSFCSRTWYGGCIVYHSRVCLRYLSMELLLFSCSIIV
jgi:hypothetical protein